MAGVIREAVVCQRHCKRARIIVDHGPITTTGSSASGKGVDAPPSTTVVPDKDKTMPTTAIRRRLHAADVNMALRLLGSEKLYAVGVTVPTPATISASTTSFSGDKHNQSAKNYHNNKIRLDDFLRHETESMPAKAPSEVGIRMHWLAIDGVQPRIPQNPMQPAAVGSAAKATIGGAPSDLHPDDVPSGATLESEEASNVLQVNQLQSSLLSEELQLYFTRVVIAMERGDRTADARQQQDAVISSIRTDVGLQELVPFLVRYIQQELYKHVHMNTVEHCRTLIRFAVALLQNPHVHLELQLHELLPALMTCVVAKQLAPAKQYSNHWALRYDAANALVLICDMFANDYSTLKARVLRTLCEAISPANDSYSSRYGGMVAISLFGPKAIDAFILPTALENWKRWEEELSEQQSSDDIQTLEIQMCMRALLDAIGVYWRGVLPDDKANELDWDDFVDTLADRWVVFLNDEESDEYASCFI